MKVDPKDIIPAAPGTTPSFPGQKPLGTFTGTYEADTSVFDKPRIVKTLNRKYGTTLTVEMMEVAVAHGFSSWESMWLDYARTLAAEADAEGPLLPSEHGPQGRR